MSFVSIIRDYVEMLNQLSDSLGTDLTLKTFLVESFFYVLQTVKIAVFYIISFQWIRDFTLLPTVIPSISSSIFSETFFLETPSKIFFEFLEIPSLDQNKLLLGFFNSFFFTLPISIIHIVALRRLIIQGIPAGVFTISGYLLGQFLFLICVLFGFRFVLIPWLTFEPLNYIIGFILIFKIIYSMVQEPLVQIRTWDWKNTKYQNFFLTSFALAWCEQTSIFQYLGNISLTSNPTLLEGFSTTSALTSLISHTNYLVGISLGSIFFTITWGFLFVKLLALILSYTPLFKSSFMQMLNKATFILALGFSLSSIPYYGLDYIFTGPLGFISQDRILNNTLLSQYKVKDSSGVFTASKDLDIEVAPFDRGRYLLAADPAQAFSFEDLNYKGEADWTARMDKMENISDRRAKLPLSKIIKTKKTTTTSNSIDSFEKFENLNSLIPQNELEKGSYFSPFQERAAKWYHLNAKHTPGEDESSRSELFEKYTTESFPTDFLRTDSLIEKDVEQKIKQKYYTNPVYKTLLAVDIDLFLNRQPATFKLSNNQELDLFTKRRILNSYYDSLRAYDKLPYSDQFETFFDGSKSFSNKIYNQQFKGTLKSVRRLFALTLDTKKLEINIAETLPQNSIGEQVLKFDQPLYDFVPSEKFSPYHEELPDFQVPLDGLKSSQFIRDTFTRPLYAGWDENLRKFVITNKLLPRTKANYQISISPEIGKSFYSDVKNMATPQKIKFTAWPLSKETLDKARNDVKIPYVTLFVPNKDEEGAPYLQQFPTLPANWETLQRRQSPAQSFDSIFDYLAPKRGGFIWPGNAKWEFTSIGKAQ